MTADREGTKVLDFLHRRCLVVALILAAASVVAPPHALAADDVDKLIQRGIELRKKGQDDAALIEFQRAYAIAKTPRTAAQLGLAEQAVGDWAAALGHVEEALAATTDPWIVKNHTTIEGALRTIDQHTARIDVLGGVDGADVEVNGRSVGKLPLKESVVVSVGAVNVVLKAPGYRQGLRTVTVAAGERTKVHFVLEAIEGGLTASVQLPRQGEHPAAELARPLAQPARDAGRRLRLGGIAAGGAGVAMLGVAVACMVTANHKLDRLEADASAGRPYDEANGIWKAFQTASVIFYVAGGLAFAGGAAAFYLGRARSAGAAATNSAAVFLAPAPGGVTVAGIF